MLQTEQLASSPFKLVGFQKSQRNAVIALLSQIKSASISLYEDGRFIADIGDTSGDLKASIDIHDPSVYSKWLFGGSIAAGETYVDGLWDSSDLPQLVQILSRNLVTLERIEKRWGWLIRPFQVIGHQLNRNSKNGSKRNILSHYDLGNEMYELFLDKQMQYSSAVYPSPTSTLEEAQEHKLTRICEQLELTESDHLLEIGTGWGGLAIKAARDFGCRVTTTTISDAQYDYACQRVKDEGLEDRITLLKNDYRDLEGQYDKVVSIEMIEAVGHQYFTTFFQQCNNRLKAGGKLLIQAITIADQRYDSYINSVDFIQKHIFPGGCLPSVEVISKHMRQDTDMVIRNISDIGLDYAKTLADWRSRFSDSRQELVELGYDDRFQRLWHFYFCYCEGGFIEKAISTVHVVAEKDQQAQSS